MFQSLRLNSQIYIFHKGNNPSLDIGKIVNISQPKPKYQIPNNFIQNPDLTVDILVKVNDQMINYNQIPANSDIADSYSNGESIVISDNREAMNSEILNYKQKSVDIINSIDLHKSIIVECDNILNTLNPEYAEKKLLLNEISVLKNQLFEMSNSLTNLTLMIEQLKSNSHEQNVGN